MKIWCFVVLLAILSGARALETTDTRSDRIIRSPQVNFEGPLNGGTDRLGFGGSRPGYGGGLPADFEGPLNGGPGRPGVGGGRPGGFWGSRPGGNFEGPLNGGPGRPGVGGGRPGGGFGRPGLG